MVEKNNNYELKTEDNGLVANSMSSSNYNNKVSMEDLNSELVKLCHMLYKGKICDEQTSSCRHYLQELFPLILQHEDLQDLKDNILMCCFYMAMISNRGKEVTISPDSGDEEDVDDNDTVLDVTITDLLQTTQLHVTTFFKAMKKIRENYNLDENIQKHLVQLEKKYCIMSALYHTFERICDQVLREEEEQDNNQENQMPPTPDTEGVVFRKTLIWTLFLHAKKNFMCDDQELVKSVHLLLCCVEYVLRLTPSFLLNPPYDVIRIGCSPGHHSNGMLAKLAENFDSCLDEVQLLQTTGTENYFQHLPNVDDLDKLTEEYLDEYRKEGDLNDLLFLKDAKSLPKVLSPREKDGNSCKELPCSVTMTPVRSALNTVQQLKTILTSGTDEPSQKLNQYFDNCSQNPRQDIIRRLKEMKEVFIDKFCGVSNLNQGEIAVHRYQLAVCLYYRVIEAMLNSEHERLSETDFSRLLNNDSFHRSLLLCSVEVVLVTYGVSWNPSTGAMGCEDSVFMFPWILDVFSLQAYEFFKVLESFIKVEPKLTGDIVRHLQTVENRILESVAWKKGSMLYDAIYKSDLAPVEVMSPSKKDIPVSHVSSAADLYLSPMKSRSGIMTPSPVKVSNSPSAVNTGPNDKLTPHRSQSLNLFFSKVCRLGFSRLQRLCDMLNVPKELARRIWTCFEHCITQRPSLLENRHIDQIMMCSIYAICKVVEKEIRFKSIVQKYRMLPHASEEVFKNVYINGMEYDSIIGFYNKVFMDAMKQFVYQFSNNKTTTPCLSPVPKTVASPVAGSQKYSVPGRKNFYVSPLKESPFKAPSSPSQMTPRSRQLYCFGDSSENLRSINERVSGYHSQRQSNTPRSSRQRLRFDQPGQDEGAPPSKAPRVIKTNLQFTDDTSDQSKMVEESVPVSKENGSV